MVFINIHEDWMSRYEAKWQLRTSNLSITGSGLLESKLYPDTLKIPTHISNLSQDAISSKCIITKFLLKR